MYILCNRFYLRFDNVSVSQIFYFANERVISRFLYLFLIFAAISFCELWKIAKIAKLKCTQKSPVIQ